MKPSHLPLESGVLHKTLSSNEIQTHRPIQYSQIEEIRGEVWPSKLDILTNIMNKEINHRSIIDTKIQLYYDAFGKEYYIWTGSVFTYFHQGQSQRTRIHPQKVGVCSADHMNWNSHLLAIANQVYPLRKDRHCLHKRHLVIL